MKNKCIKFRDPIAKLQATAQKSQNSDFSHTRVIFGHRLIQWIPLLAVLWAHDTRRFPYLVKWRLAARHTAQLEHRLTVNHTGAVFYSAVLPPLVYLGRGQMVTVVILSHALLISISQVRRRRLKKKATSAWPGGCATGQAPHSAHKKKGAAGTRQLRD